MVASSAACTLSTLGINKPYSTAAGPTLRSTEICKRSKQDTDVCNAISQYSWSFSELAVMTCCTALVATSMSMGPSIWRIHAMSGVGVLGCSNMVIGTYGKWESTPTLGLSPLSRMIAAFEAACRRMRAIGTCRKASTSETRESFWRSVSS